MSKNPAPERVMLDSDSLRKILKTLISHAKELDKFPIYPSVYRFKTEAGTFAIRTVSEERLSSMAKIVSSGMDLEPGTIFFYAWLYRNVSGVEEKKLVLIPSRANIFIAVRWHGAVSYVMISRKDFRFDEESVRVEVENYNRKYFLLEDILEAF